MLRTRQMRHKALKEAPPIEVPESAVPHWERAGWELADDAPTAGTARVPEPPRDPAPQPAPQQQTPPAEPAVPVTTPARRQPTTERSAD